MDLLQDINTLLEDITTLFDDSEYLGGLFSISDTFSIGTEEIYA